MTYIPLEQHLPGITGLLEYRKDTAAPIRELTQILLRGPSSLTQGERELIATVVSSRNDCTFCMKAHTAAADLLFGENTTSQKVIMDCDTSPVSDKMKSLLRIAIQVAESGKSVTEESVQNAKKNGATDLELHDTVLIASLFCMYNRYVDGLAAFTPSDSEFYRSLADRIVNNGYQRLPHGYDHLK